MWEGTDTDDTDTAWEATVATDPSALLTIDDVAARLRVNERSVRRYIAAGDLEAIHLGRAVRVAPAALDAYLSDLPRAQERRRAQRAAIPPKRTRAAKPAPRSNGARE